MDCNTTRRLLDAYLDHELDVAHDLEVGAHLRTCPACAAVRDAAEQRRTALRERLPRFAAPAGLAGRIRAALPASEVPVPPRMTASPRQRVALSGWWAAGLAAALVCATAGGMRWGEIRARQNLLFDEAIGEHVRSLQVDHLMDVISTDQHTVKPWFAGKIDFSPPVADLAAAGFPLVGGRLDHLAGRPAAALVFKRRQHVINLFVWPAAERPISRRARSAEGYCAESWSFGGLDFLAISEIPEAELADFAAKFRAATTDGGG
jgi:anti-sigma factor RsiW